MEEVEFWKDKCDRTRVYAIHELDYARIYAHNDAIHTMVGRAADAAKIDYDTGKPIIEISELKSIAVRMLEQILPNTMTLEEYENLCEARETEEKNDD